MMRTILRPVGLAALGVAVAAPRGPRLDAAWWQQRAILLDFTALLPNDATTTAPTVNPTPGGAPLAAQLAPIPPRSRSAADPSLGPNVCTGRPPPGGPTPAP